MKLTELAKLIDKTVTYRIDAFTIEAIIRDAKMAYGNTLVKIAGKNCLGEKWVNLDSVSFKHAINNNN